MSMEFENENVLDKTKGQQSQGVVHQKVDEEEPKAPEQVELPVDEPEQIVDLLGEPIKDENTSKKPSSKPASAKKEAKQKKEPETYGTDFTIAYARYTDILPKEDMTLDDVREWLEVDYPELSKERTKMDVDLKTKVIVPLVMGAKKG